MIKPGNVVEVVIGLPAASMVLDIISEGCTLDKAVVLLMAGQLSIVVIESFQNGVSLIERTGALFQEMLLGDVRNYSIVRTSEGVQDLDLPSMCPLIDHP